MVSSEGSISNRAVVTIRGIVQGVGFRPFVYREAKDRGITGYVINTSEGVVVDAQGSDLERFLEALRENAPAQARVDAIDIRYADPTEYADFEIRESRSTPGSAAIPPERALCAACEAEMRDPSNRRYGYPFINCTDCGPRYTIIQTPPYDRVRTSMHPFEMCEACRAEYTDPASRRFHAEPISCPECGPKLSFWTTADEQSPSACDNSTFPSAGGSRTAEPCLKKSQFIEAQGDPIERAAEMLKEGKIIALKGLGGFHLMCDATSEAAVQELRRRKRRRAKPLAVMFGSMEQLRRCARISEVEAALIGGDIKPVVIVDASGPETLAPSVAPGISRLGVFLPYTPLHCLLFDRIGFPLVATSANFSDEPICSCAEEVVARLGEVVDAILDHDRAIVNPLDDAVVQLAAGKPLMLRMGRGFAPLSLPLSEPVFRPVLAVGAHQKSAVALAVGRTLVLGGHIGDLGSVEAEGYYERNVRTLERLYRCDPAAVVHDTHPLYASSAYAAGRGQPMSAVQHHHAHILACMAEYGLRTKVLGFAFDGTGYGEDGTMWGGEVIIADPHGYERVGFFRPFPLLGGEKAVKEPRRIALALLFERYTPDELLSMGGATVEAFLPHEIRQLHHLWSKRIYAPLSSSLGRLFDAVASLGGFVQNLDYEGEGGLVMEGFVDPLIEEPFAFAVGEGGAIDVGAMVEEIVSLSLHPDGKRQIASRFIATVVEIIARFADRYPDLPVVVGGGVFQNRALMERLYRVFSSRPFYAQQRTPINDGSIALGQGWWGIHNL